jgi:hypothetical protein
MTRQRFAVLFAALAVVVTTSATLPTTSAGAVSPGCRWSQRGFDENRWLGGPGTWSDPTHWSKGVVPGLVPDSATQDYACIPADSFVVIDQATPRIDLEILELGRDATLSLQPGTAMFVWGDQATVRSITKRGSLIDLDGATLGGPGRLHVIGELDVHPSSTGRRAVLGTSPDRTAYDGAPGILEIGDEGLLDISGKRDVRLSARYLVDVHGKARLRGQASILADFGTTFMLQKHYFGPGVGKLIVLNDGDFAVGATAGSKVPPTFVNRGRIAKRGPGLTNIQGRYFVGGRGKVSGDGGGHPFALLIPPSFVQNTASSGSKTSARDPQVASLLIPVTDPDGAEATIKPLDGLSVGGAVGVPMQVHATGLVANVADPALVELRYDTTLFGGKGPAADPATLAVGHADGPGDPYTDVPSCEGRGLPVGAFACVDRLASRVEGNTLVMVVRTIDTSRWIAH